MSIYESALDDYRFYLSRGSEPLGTAWLVAGMYRNVTNEVELAKALLDSNKQ